MARDAAGAIDTVRVEHDLERGSGKEVDKLRHTGVKRRQKDSHGHDHAGLKITATRLRRDVKDTVGVLQ